MVGSAFACLAAAADPELSVVVLEARESVPFDIGGPYTARVSAISSASARRRAALAFKAKYMILLCCTDEENRVSSILRSS